MRFEHTLHRPDRCCIQCHINNVQDVDVANRRAQYTMTEIDSLMQPEYLVGPHARHPDKDGQARRIKRR